MTWTLLDSGQGTFDQSATSTSVSFGVSLQEDDICIVQAGRDAADVEITTSGYTPIIEGSINQQHWDVVYKVMGATPDSDFTLNQPSGSQHSAFIYQVWRGVDTSDVLDSTGVTATNLGRNPEIPGFAVSASALIFHCGHLDDDNESTSTTVLEAGTETANMTNFQCQAADDNVGQSCSIMMASRVSTASETLSTGGFDCTNSDASVGLGFSLNMGAVASQLGHGLIFSHARNYALIG